MPRPRESPPAAESAAHAEPRAFPVPPVPPPTSGLTTAIAESREEPQGLGTPPADLESSERIPH